MTTIQRFLMVMLLLMMATPAGAVFHLWRMTELYSNADGTVQFLEFGVDVSGEQFIGQHGLTATSGGVTHSFVFPSDLVGNTAGRTFIVATEGFAALGVLTPDYVVPNGFFFKDGGFINFAGVDNWEHLALPANGSASLYRDGTQATNSPQNFAGQTAVLTAASQAALNFQALWWKSPAGSESGWGVNITHQGDTLFATWFTYDVDGSGMWLVVSDARKSAGNTYSGALYRTTGPAFSSVPFDPAQIAVTQVGSATFTFTDADNGTFAYVVGGISQSKPITRQVFSSPVSACAASASSSTRQSYQDLWWRSPAGSESGWGVNITHQGDILFATWFTYDAGGRGLWLAVPDARMTSTGNYTGTLYRTTGPVFSASPWNPALVTVTPVGTATFSFPDGNTGTFAYTFNGVSQTKSILRQAYASPLTICH